jgi:hypothetical protein
MIVFDEEKKQGRKLVQAYFPDMFQQKNKIFGTVPAKT